MNKKLTIALAVPLVLVAAAAAYRHFALVEPLKARVVAKLNDPESAQFRNLKLYSDWRLSGSILCGEFNARNRMGGYVGFTHFEAHGWTDEPDIESEVMKELHERPGTELKRCPYEEESRWWHPPK